MTNRDVLDPAVVDSLRELTVPGEPDVLSEVLRLFLDDAPRRLERLKAAWRDGDAGELRRAAHSLKGSSGNIGARHMYDICKQLDERGKAGDLTGARPLLDSLDEEFGRVESEIQRLLK